MYLNKFADGTTPEDMTGTDEFRSLLTSAADLGIAHDPGISYRSCNIVLRQQRFHFLEWGDRDAPPIVLLHVADINPRIHGISSAFIWHKTITFWRWISAAMATASGRATWSTRTTPCHSTRWRSSTRWDWKNRS